jgi:hypothetical protein
MASGDSVPAFSSELQGNESHCLNVVRIAEEPAVARRPDCSARALAKLGKVREITRGLPNAAISAT